MLRFSIRNVRAKESAWELLGSIVLTPSPRPGAPHLAGFPRDVGYHSTFPLTLDSPDTLNSQHRRYPTSREKPARCGAPGLGEGVRTALKAVPFILFGILRAVFCKPRLVSLEKRNGVLNVFIRRPVVTAHHIVLDQVFEFGPVLKIHTWRLPEFHGCATQN